MHEALVLPGGGEPAAVRPGITVIVVTYESHHHLPRLVAALAAQELPPDRLIVVDNGSRDGSVAVARTALAAAPQLANRTLLVPLATNVGFAAANNHGIALAETEHVALLNPDAFPAPGWLAALGDAAARHPDCAAFGSRQMQAGRTGVVDGLGDCYSLTGLAWRRRHGRGLTAGDLCGREIFSACAAAALYRRAAVLAVGGFDADYFCYFEDVDLGLRLRLAGHRARYVPAAVVEHVGGASSEGGRGATATYFGHRNLVWTAIKGLPQPLLTCSLLAQIPQTIIALTVCACRGQMRAFLAGKVDAVRDIRVCLRKRAVVQRSRRIGWLELWKAFDAPI